MQRNSHSNSAYQQARQLRNSNLLHHFSRGTPTPSLADRRPDSSSSESRSDADSVVASASSNDLPATSCDSTPSRSVNASTVVDSAVIDASSALWRSSERSGSGRNCSQKKCPSEIAGGNSSGDIAKNVDIRDHWHSTAQFRVRKSRRRTKLHQHSSSGLRLHVRLGCRCLHGG